MSVSASDLAPLLNLAREVAVRSHAPYSHRAEGAVLLLRGGRYVPGVLVESASFSLVLPAIVNAFSTAVALGAPEVTAVVLDHPARVEERHFVELALPGFEAVNEYAFVRAGLRSLPSPGEAVSPYLSEAKPSTPEEGVALARRVAEGALVPESHFPVGCVAVTSEGRLVPGVNVEVADWSRILCAERNALGTLFSYGLAPAPTFYLTCLNSDCSPCGACRQLLAEHAPESTVWMARRDAPPLPVSPLELLPGSFLGDGLSR